MALKFQNRIDYVNLEAYGAGKVNINKYQDEDSDEDNIDEFNLQSHTNTQARILNKIAGFEKKTDAIVDSLSMMAIKQDEGILRLTGQMRMDEY